ncbi:hypothetical protein [Chakrabartyella piscis]|uniref:hypothetical protein n=1 Tax=Chakrabartyella piscis TaxID=2918914 RepID=UPI00295848C5|nr:hypothetical protein [Chakrabartyella piscis]
MLDAIFALELRDVFYAATLAYLIWFALGFIKKIIGLRTSMSITVEKGDVVDVYKKCKELFPIEAIPFHGKVFKRGMKVQLLTEKDITIEGELIGLSHKDLICIRTTNKIVAHQLEKIKDIKEM